MDFKIEQFEKFNDDRGQLIVFLRNNHLPESYKQFGQIYFVTFEKPGVVRGNHYHQKWREWFGVVSGKIEIKLKDVNTGEEADMIIDGSSNTYIRLEIGPNIAHAFRNLSPEASLLNYCDTEWSADDTFRHELM